MKKLFLLRHAKSSWADPCQDDFDRPLNKRGHHAGEAMRDQLAAASINPELILCSPARRAKETLALVFSDSKKRKVEFDKGLYVFDYRPVLDRLRQVDKGVLSVMVIGHNPALEELARILTGADFAKYPTCALAEISAPVKSWSKLEPGACALDNFVKPKDLKP